MVAADDNGPTWDDNEQADAVDDLLDALTEPRFDESDILDVYDVYDVATAGATPQDTDDVLDMDDLICERLRAEDPHSAFAVEHRKMLLEACHGQVMAWLYSGVFFERNSVASTGRTVAGTTADLPRDDLLDLAHDILFAGHRLFWEHGIEKRRWVRSKGASLKTYYLNACIREFPNIYRRWQRGQQRWQRVELAPDLVDIADTTTYEDSGYASNNFVILRELLAQLDPDDQLLLWWKYIHGYSHEQLAHIVGKTPKSIESAIYRAKKRMRAAAGNSMANLSVEDGDRNHD
jgi:RNA polymerase sigma factor (sigma-70 family)